MPLGATPVLAIPYSRLCQDLILQSSGSSSLPAASSAALPVDAVWSVIVAYILEAELLGALALTMVQIMVLRVIVRSSACLVRFSCLGTWLAGVVFTTSYLPLLPIWPHLSVLLGWDRIVQVRANASGPRPGLTVSPVRKGVKT